jgi:tRNA threonylcarbamoyladenosine biosynthesis protein TsaB
VRVLLLALDTSTSAITVALHDGSDVRAERAVTDARKHTEHLAPLVEEVLDAAGVRPDRLTDIAVGTGPGPFTGLRVGLVTARTLGFALGVPVYGVSSLDVLAHQARGLVSGNLLVATDARRKEVYWAVYAARSGHVERLSAPSVDRPADLEADVRALPTVGRGPLLYPDLFPAPLSVHDASAGALAELAVARVRSGARMPVDALYLRRPDATPAVSTKSTVPDGWRGA